MKINKLFFVIAAVLITNSGGLFAQDGPVRMMAPPSGTSKIASPDGIAVFSFELVTNHIVIPVEINSARVRLILDTGMPMEGMILSGNKTVEKLNLAFMGKAQVMGAADGAVVMADLAMGIDFKLPNVEFDNQMVLVMPDSPLKEVDGIIGNSIFKHFVTMIDYDKMEITLMEPDKFNYTGEGERVPLEIGMHPMTSGEIELEDGNRVPMNMTVDTGFHGAVGLNASREGGRLLPKKCIEAFAGGVGEKIPISIGRIKGFHIGGYRFSNLLGTFSEKLRNGQKEGGVLGQGILKRFNVIFDYAHHSMILEPNTKFNESFEFENMAGFLPERTDKGLFKIIHIYSGSSAAEVGLRKGDILEKIDGKPVEKLTSDEANMLLGREGREVTLVIQRDGENITKRIVLRRLI